MPDFWEQLGSLSGDLTQEEREDRERELSLSLPVKYWIPTLAAVHLSCLNVQRKLNELRVAGKTEKDLNELQTSALAAPIHVRSAIVELLSKAGVMTDAARKKAGFDLLRKLIDEGTRIINEREKGEE